MVHTAPRWAQLPPVTSPAGVGWMAPWIDPTAAQLAQIAVFVGALLGLLGWHARLGFAVVALCGTYLLALPQFHGGVQHAHHLVWFAALLAVSPASDALALDSYSRPRSGRSLGWGVPTRVAWLLLAAIYFFPGLHKFGAQGLGWAGDHLTTTLYWKWAQAWDFEPLTRIDRWPTLLWIGGLGVLGLELGAPLLLWNRWTRLLLALGATLFHTATALWFDIGFWHLVPCLVVLLPFPETEEEGHARRWVPAAMMGSVLLMGAGTAGALRITQGWPFACYPTFDRPIDRWMPTLQVIAHTADSSWVVPEHTLAAPANSKSFYSEVWAVTGHYGSVDPRSLERLWLRLAARPEVRDALGEASWVTLHRAERSVDPEHPAVRTGVTLARIGGHGPRLGHDWNRSETVIRNPTPRAESSMSRPFVGQPRPDHLPKTPPKAPMAK